MKDMMRFFLAIGMVCLLFGCKQSDPPNFGRVGDVVLFSGYEWNVKHAETVQGPGPNWFSNDPDDIYVDDQGYLHMWINERDGKWFATEIVSEDTMGYGTYKFTIEGDFVNMPDNVTVGLFTWDNNSFYEHANSEIDVELSKWGETEKQNTLQYAVQPVSFSTFFPERVFNPSDTEDYLIGVTTHVFNWTDSLITFKSYFGEDELAANQIAEWSFGLDNPPRVKEEGGQSSLPIVIPGPGNTTNARINYWLQPWINQGPSGGVPQELIVRHFSYSPN
jgi:hypothetical protein